MIYQRLSSLISSAHPIPKNDLGRTGIRVTSLGLGGQGVLEQEGKDKEAETVIKEALEQGINYFDTAPYYGPSRKYLGNSLGDKRKLIYLASKVRERSQAGAKKELDESFKLLKTDYIDIVQLHYVDDDQDMLFLSKNGAIQTLVEAKKAGKIGFIGVTGHHAKILNKYLNEFNFDTVLMPINPVYMPENQEIIARARAIGIGVIGMKLMGRGCLIKGNNIDELLKFGLVLADTCIVGCDNALQVTQNANVAKQIWNRIPVQVNLMPNIETACKEAIG